METNNVHPLKQPRNLRVVKPAIEEWEKWQELRDELREYHGDSQLDNIELTDDYLYFKELNELDGMPALSRNNEDYFPEKDFREYLEQQQIERLIGEEILEPDHENIHNFIEMVEHAFYKVNIFIRQIESKSDDSHYLGGPPKHYLYNRIKDFLNMDPDNVGFILSKYEYSDTLCKDFPENSALRTVWENDLKTIRTMVLKHLGIIHK